MKTPIRAAVCGALASLALAVGLCGCAAPATTHSPSAGHNGSGSPGQTTTAHPVTPTATPSSTAPLPANALFRITATAEQPTGAKMDLVQVVYAPSAPTAPDTALLDGQCNLDGQPTWESGFPGGALYLTSTVTATAHPGSPAFNNLATIGYELGSGSSAWSGDYSVEQSYCAPGSIALPGQVHGVSPVLASNPVTSAFGWGAHTSTYGLDGDGNDPSDPNGGGDTVVGNCAVQLSPAAIAAVPGIVAWTTQPYVATVGCYYTMP
jgi:hypothetical protein